MNIIQVYQTNPFEEGQGGGVRYVKNLLNGLKNSCDSILFIGIGSKKESKDNISLIPVTKELTGYIRFLFVLILKLPFMDLKKYEIVHVHRLYFAIPFIILKPNLKIVSSLHGRTFSVFESKYGPRLLSIFKILFKKIELFCIKKIDYLMPVSMDVINSFNDRYNNFYSKNKSKMTVASPLINFNDYKIYDEFEAKRLFGLDYKFDYMCFLGRLSDVKDVYFLLNLMSEHKNFFKLNKIKLIIFGKGESENGLKEEVAHLCIKDLIIFYGEVKPRDIDKAIACSKLMLLSSKHESGPIVIKESLICGIPVVSNNVGEVKDFIFDGVNGFIVKKNTESYINSIKRVFNTNFKKEKVREFSLDKLSISSVESISNLHLKVYKKILRK